MKALVEMELRVLERTALGPGWSGVLLGGLLAPVLASLVLHSGSSTVPLGPVLLFAALPWVLLSSHVLQVTEKLAATLPVARSRLLIAHLLQTGSAWVLVAVCVAALLRSAHPEGEEGPLLLQLFLLVLIVTWTPALVQAAFARRSATLGLLAAVLYFAFIPWKDLLLPHRTFVVSDIQVPGPGLPALVAQAGLTVLLGTLVFLRSGERVAAGDGSGVGNEGESRQGEASIGVKSPRGRAIPVSLLLSAFPPYTGVMVMMVLFSLPARQASADAFVLCMIAFWAAQSHQFVLRSWRWGISLPMDRSRAFRILMIPSLALLLFGAGLRAVLAQLGDRSRIFPAAGLTDGGGFVIDRALLAGRVEQEGLFGHDSGIFERQAANRLEDRFGFRPDPARMRAAVHGFPKGAAYSDDRWQQNAVDISHAYQRILVAFSREIRRALLVRSFADGMALLLVGALLSRIFLHPWKRAWHRHVTLGAIGLSSLLVIIPDSDFSGGAAPALRDVYYAAFQSMPVSSAAGILAVTWLAYRSCARDFARLEWDMLPEPPAGGIGA